MMTAKEIISTIAQERRVEQMVSNICHKDMDADTADLSQMVYLILLEYDEDKITELWANGEINFFIVRIIINQFRSANSPFHALIRKFRENSEAISGKDWIEE